ncbi:MAG: hypothetical protein K9J06_00360 [Flavobacteriales bacterium]|nr:hypothetical protein [Flavobacteriales bacterium]
MEIITKNISRLSHQNSLGEKEIDGTGFIAEIGGRSVLVSCGHVFQGQPGKEHSFIYNNSIHNIEIDSLRSNYFQRYSAETILEWPHDLKVVAINDYAFYCLPFVAENPIQLKALSEVTIEDELYLITRDEQGRILKLPCKRSSAVEGAYYYPEKQDRCWALNLIEVDVHGLEKGFSGAPIIHIASGTCIGILQGSTHEKSDVKKTYLRGIVIPSDTLVEKFLLLSKGTSE